MYRIATSPISAAEVRAAVDRPQFGAVLVFEGVARNHFEGRPVLALEYEAWAEMAEAELRRIGEEARTRWEGIEVACVHRVGRLSIGEPSVVIAVGAPHRGAAYEASRYVIDELKRRVPVWKKEIYADGGAWKSNPEAQ